MQSERGEQEVSVLLDRLEAREPTIVELGTPMLEDGPEMEALVAMGAGVVPALQREAEVGPPRRTAYAVRALGLIGGPGVAATLRHLCDRHSAEPNKTMWHHAVVAQCNAALRSTGPDR